MKVTLRFILKKWWQSYVALLLVLWIILAAFSDAVLGAEGSLILDSAFVVRDIKDDSGTLYAYLRNNEDKASAVERVYLNGSDVWPVTEDKKIAEISVWCRVYPNPVPAHGVAEIIVKLSSRNEPLTLRILLSTGHQIGPVIVPNRNHPLKCTYVGFSPDFRQTYIYFSNRGSRKFHPEKLFMGCRDVTTYSSIPWRSIATGERKCIVIHLQKPLLPGQWITLKLITKEGISAECGVRAIATFPIRLAGRKTETSLLLDFDPISSERLVLCPGHRHGSVAESARNLIQLNENASSGPTYKALTVYHCRNSFEHGAKTFSPLADVARCNPSFRFEDDYFLTPRPAAEHPIQARTRIQKTLCEPHALQTMVVATGEGTLNPDISPEILRFIVWYEVSRGSKGIWYRDVGLKRLKDRLDVRKAMKELNSELQVLKRFMSIGEVVGGGKVNHPYVEATIIQAGFQALVALLINKKPIELGPKGFYFSSKENIQIEVQIPEGMKISDAYEVGGTWERTRYKVIGRHLVLKIPQLALTRQFVLTTDDNDFNYDTDGDSISDIEEVSKIGTHPAVSDVDAGILP